MFPLTKCFPHDDYLRRLEPLDDEEERGVEDADKAERDTVPALEPNAGLDGGALAVGVERVIPPC